MRVAIISAEAVPYSKTGGLGDVAGALPKALKAVGVDSVLVTPCYLQTKGEYLWETAIRRSERRLARRRLSGEGILQRSERLADFSY